VEGVPEAIGDGIDGVLANPGDAADLSQSIERVIHRQSSWSQLRASAHRRHAQHFSDECMARGVAEVYRKVLQS
jgi:glycosyltransferase involved in cell wall biosynthesis